MERRLAPADNTHRFAGLAGWVLPGRPIDGGFGALPWRAHITSRHAWWGLQLILAPGTTPWVAIARALLRECAPEVGSHPMGLLLWSPDEPMLGMGGAHLPQPLRRLHAGLASLPSVRDVEPRPLEPGPWCWAAPLWGNPLLRSPAHPTGIDHTFFDLAAARIATLGQLLSTERAVTEAMGSPAAYWPVWQTRLHGYPPFADRHHTAERIQQLLAALPQGWVQAARAAAASIAAGQLQPPSQQDAMTVVLHRLGWDQPGQPPLRLSAFTVRAGTALLTAPTELRRVQQHLSPFAALAGGELGELQRLLRRLWRLPWENCQKEPFWRLIYDAFPTAARLHLDEPCMCGGAPADRHHHYWSCPVAQAVTDSISAALAERQPQHAPQPLTLGQLWLARPPGGVHEGVWQVVCLAALRAMDGGRRRMYALRFGPANPPPHFASLVASSARFAVRRFWSLLADFVGLGRVPRTWRARCPPGHPFIYFDPTSRSFTVDRPALAPATPSQ